MLRSHFLDTFPHSRWSPRICNENKMNREIREPNLKTEFLKCILILLKEIYLVAYLKFNK